MKYAKPEAKLVDNVLATILGQLPKHGVQFDNSPMDTTYITVSAYEADE
ncbi:MAG TPA: hypothetical protein VNE63_23750 [Candidatus Acidoferrales bacterium]|nr:hypothetical protein [Candidatus Acidoferrales bacterium]